VDKNILGVFPRELISVPEPVLEKKTGNEPRWKTRDLRIVGMGAAKSDDHAEAGRAAGKGPDRVLDFRIGCVITAPLFHGLSMQECSEIASAAQEQRFLQQEIIFGEDDPVRYVFVIANGRVKVTQLSEAGKEVILRVDGPGALVDGLGTLIPVHTSTARSIGACRVLAWGVGAFDVFARRFPAIPRNAVGIMAARLKILEERFCDVTTKRVSQRLARVLIRLAEQSLPREPEPIGLSREELAQMTGTTLFTVSRVLHDWAEQDIVQVDRKAIVVEQLPRLIQLADDAARPEAARLYHR
jgi:CRP-like cAMP-binding protein